MSLSKLSGSDVEMLIEMSGRYGTSPRRTIPMHV